MVAVMYDYIESLPLVDSLAYLPPCEEARPRRDIVAEFLADAPADALLAAGFDAEMFAMARNEKLSVREKWDVIAPYWTKAQYTSGCKAIMLAICELYGFDTIERENIEALDMSFRSTFNSDRYNYILKERCGIEFSVLLPPETDNICRNGGDAGMLSADRRYFITVNDICGLVAPRSREEVFAVGRQADVTASSFDDYLEACARVLKRFAQENGIIICGGGTAPVQSSSALDTAYKKENYIKNRLPSPRKTSYSDARGAYDNFMYGSRSSEPVAMYRYVYRFLLGLAAEKNMTFRLDEDARNCTLADDPDCFRELCALFPELKFDVLVSAYHRRCGIGYMAGIYPNVYANLSRAECALPEYLEFVPYNKIIAFGSGCRTIDAVYGRAVLVREGIARILQDKIAAGGMKSYDAKTIASALTSGNAHELYGRTEMRVDVGG